jgi:hypothetical protein
MLRSGGLLVFVPLCWFLNTGSSCFDYRGVDYRGVDYKGGFDPFSFWSDWIEG